MPTAGMQAPLTLDFSAPNWCDVITSWGGSAFMRSVFQPFFFWLLMSALPSTLCAQALSDKSSAQVAINVSVPAKVSISQIADVTLDSWSGTGDLESEQNVCVWSSTGTYTIAMSTTEGKKGFGMLGPAGKELQYSVLWNSGSGYQQVVSGQTYAGLPANSSSINCNKGDDGVNRPLLKVAVAEKDLNSAKAGQYSDVLQILIATQ